MPDETPDPERELEREPETLPELGPLPLDDYPSEGDYDPRIQERPPPEDYGIPHIDVDRHGQFKVPKLKADYCLLERANTEFYMGLGLDVPKPIDWLWPGRIPIGKLTLIEGESNSGTSFLVADMAARVTADKSWPGVITASQPTEAQPTEAQPTEAQPTEAQPTEAQPTATQPTATQPADVPPAGTEAKSPYRVILDQPNHVMIVNGGDNMHDTLLPRLINMGAGLYNFTILSGIITLDPAEMRAGKTETNRRISLPADLPQIEYQLRSRPDTRLLVVDSLSDFCHTDKQFRETLRGLHEIAERCNVAVVATARPKNWHSARSKLKPSADRRGESVRCVLNVLVDPHDPSQRYLAPARMNFCREPNWLPFRIGDGKVDWGEPLATPPVYSRLSEAAQEKVTLLMEAKECLWKTLAAGDTTAKSALKQVMECGFSKATVVRARRELGVRCYREGFGRHGWWNWSIKPEGAAPAAGAPGESAFGGNGVHENGNGDLDASPVMPTETGAAGAEQPEPADEFGGDRFQRIFRAAVLATLNRERAAELAGGELPNGKKGKNGRRPKPR